MVSKILFREIKPIFPAVCEYKIKHAQINLWLCNIKYLVEHVKYQYEIFM